MRKSIVKWSAVVIVLFFFSGFAASCLELAAGSEVAPTKTPTPEPTPVIESTPSPFLTAYIPVFQVPITYRPVGYSWSWFGYRELVDETLVKKYYRHFPMNQDANPYPDIELLPMVKCNQLDLWNQNYPNGWDKEIFVLNEPTLWGEGCYLNPEEAANFISDFRELCPDCYIIAGNMSQVAPQEWFNEFMGYEPPLDAIGIHFYDWIPGNPEEQLEFYASFGFPIYVTEWGVLDASRIAYYRNLWGSEPLVKELFYFAPYIPPREIQESVEGGIYCCWPTESRLFNEEGTLTDIGLTLFGYLP